MMCKCVMIYPSVAFMKDVCVCRELTSETHITLLNFRKGWFHLSSSIRCLDPRCFKFYVSSVVQKNSCSAHQNSCIYVRIHVNSLVLALILVPVISADTHSHQHVTKGLR